MRLLARASAPFVYLLSVSTEALLNPLLRLLRIRPQEDGAQPLSAEEMRTIVLESSHILPKKHASILLNLFDLGDLTVQDVMLPRTRIESITLETSPEDLVRQISTAYHMRLPVFGNHEGDLLGVLHLRKALGLLATGSLDRQAIEELVTEAYFIPASTPALAQLQFFQERKEHIALVVDEYGELMGLVTLEDIIEEIIGKFTTRCPSANAPPVLGRRRHRDADGAMQVREVQSRTRPGTCRRRPKRSTA